VNTVFATVALKGRKPFIIICDGQPKAVANVAVRELAHVLAASVPLGASV